MNESTKGRADAMKARTTDDGRPSDAQLIGAIDSLLGDVELTPPAGLAGWLQNAVLETEREIFDRLLRCRVFVTENPDDERSTRLVGDMIAYHRAARERIGLQQETECSLTGLCKSRPAMDLTLKMIELDMRMDSIRKAHPEFAFA